MRTLLSWSTALSLLCSLSVTQFAVNVAQPTVQWAAAGNAQAIQSELSALISTTGSSITTPLSTPVVNGRAVAVRKSGARSERLDAIVAWILAQGRRSSIGSRIATALGIPRSEDLPVIGKGYRTDDGVIHVFDVSTVTSPYEIILYRKVGNAAIDWRVTRAGTIITTVMVDQDVRVVPNDQYAAVLAAELAYWDTKVPPAPAQTTVGTN